MEKQKSSADKVYDQVLEMATFFEFKPDERINEGNLAKTLGTSRTPLREALNRLVAEGFLKLKINQGFYCRSLEPTAILDLYTARLAIETEAVRLAISTANDEDIAKVMVFLDETEGAYSSTSSFKLLAELDEKFHLHLVQLSGNRELERILLNLNARIRYIRQIDMHDRRSVTPAEHRSIVAAIAQRDEEIAIFELRDHINRRQEEATESVKRAFSQLYVPS